MQVFRTKTAEDFYLQSQNKKEETQNFGFSASFFLLLIPRGGSVQGLVICEIELVSNNVQKAQSQLRHQIILLIKNKKDTSNLTFKNIKTFND